ncbi:MAG: CDGSH iron-sulfur domain-containing protein [Calditrichaeota bacterium]|nr:CDGSH iron-sulfur domain-containing protein [Calditrichota bacterium]
MTDNKLKITVTENGPLLVEGNTEIFYESGKWTKEKKKMYLCRCGASSNKPFCDGTHNKVDFKG